MKHTRRPMVLGLMLAACVALPAERIFAQEKPAPKKNVVQQQQPASTKVKTEFFPLADVKPGMSGIAYTVFAGTKPEPMQLEILGVMKNMAGPRSDVILARMKGENVEHTGVAGGMSGSPVYIDGKLVGAIAYRIGQFTKEPIAGITPIEYMMEIHEMDSTPENSRAFRRSAPAGIEYSKTSAGESGAAGIAEVPQMLTPIKAPLAFSGFSEETIKLFGDRFAEVGVMPVMGAGGASDEPQPEAIEAGSSVGAVLVRGDMDITATCTVTYADENRLLACGHPLMQFGQVNMPMTKSRVITTLASPLQPNKVALATEPIGSFVQDRHTGILGRFGPVAPMIPVTLNIHGGSRPRTFKFEVLNSAKLTPAAMMSTVFNALRSVNEFGEEVTYRMRGNIAIDGYPAVTLENMYAPSDAGQPTAMGVALSLGDRIGRIYENQFVTPSVKGVELNFDMVRERRSARLESARTDVIEARPGDEIMIEATLRPYRGEPIVRQIPVKIPTSTQKGTLRILVSDGATLDRARNINTAFMRRSDLDSIIGLLNREHANSKLYVSLLESNPLAMVGEKVMPTLPISVMNVMDGMRGTQEMVVLGESAKNEASTPVDYVVSGLQVITINIK